MSWIIQIFGSIFLACIPAMIWGHLFYRKNPQNRHLIKLTFIAGALAVFPILIYKALWQFMPWINAFKIAENYKNDLIGLSTFAVIPLSIIITFMLVGLIEEIMKLLAVKAVDEDEIKTVDDAMEFFVVAACGFAFTENILYFYNILITYGPQHILMPFLFRSSFSTLAHIIFSGVLGYYYGVAHFAAPILQEEIRKNRKKWTRGLYKIFNFRREKLFYEEHIFEGLILSIGLHALFNILLEMNWTFLIVPFLAAGYTALNYLFEKKQNHKNYGKLLSRLRNHPHPKTGVHFKAAKVKS